MIIQTIEALDNFILRITSDANEIGFFDVSPYLDGEVFSPLKEANNFSLIHNGKYYIEWDCGADLSADTIEAKWKKIES